MQNLKNIISGMRRKPYNLKEEIKHHSYHMYFHVLRKTQFNSKMTNPKYHLVKTYRQLKKN